MTLSYQDPSYYETIQRLKHNARQVYAPAPGLERWAIIAISIGLLGFLIGIFYAPGRTWGAFDANFLFWMGLSQGAIIVAAVFNTAWAKWGRVIQRVIEPMGLFSALSPLLFLVLWLGRSHIFRWVVEKQDKLWLSSSGMLLREEAMLILMAGLSLWWLYRSIRPDLGLLSGSGAPKDRFREWLLQDYKGQKNEVQWTGRVLPFLGPAIIIGFCWGYGMLAVDLALTVDPQVKSTMFPGIYWVSEFLAALALGAVMVWAWRRSNDAVAELIPPSIIQDLANMVWAFAIFRTWFDWSQYIIWWYGNLPDEAGYLIDRWRTAPWAALAWISLFLEFIIPFFAGFSRHLKRNPVGMAALGAIVFLGILARTFTDVMPSIQDLGRPDLGLIELAVTVGFAGGAAWSYLWLVRRVPLFPISDPLFNEALETRGAPET